jgi:hypothetical protein
MRLLNARTLQVEEFIGTDIPPYAILSHTWTDDEVSFQDITLHRSLAFEKSGYRKIRWCAAQTLADGLTHCWADTCCIDKTSSAELSEAINSMFRYYRDSEFCYVYLADVRVEPASELGHAVSSSRWFTRGWTLQELVAPRNRFFFDADWKLIGKILPDEADVLEDGPPLTTPLTTPTSPTPSRRFRSSLMDVDDAEGFPLSIALDQRIPLDLLCHRTTLADYCVAEKMFYAVKRSTTRPEDRSYSLVGIFDVNMPLLYGEGGDKAFLRLQEEIIKKDFDHSIFDWALPPPKAPLSAYRGLLARSPDDFTVRKQYANQLEHEYQFQFPYSMTNCGLKMKLAMMPTGVHPGEYIAGLNCRHRDTEECRKIILVQIGAHDQYARVDAHTEALEFFSNLEKRLREEGSARDVFVKQEITVGPNYRTPRLETWIIHPPSASLQLYLRQVLPESAWCPSERTIQLKNWRYLPVDRGPRCARVVFQCKSGWSYIVRLRAGVSIEGGCDHKIARIDSDAYDKLRDEEGEEEDDIEYTDTVEYKLPNVPTLRHPSTGTVRNGNDSQLRNVSNNQGDAQGGVVQPRSLQLGLQCVSKIVNDKVAVVVKLSIITQGPQPRGLRGIHLSPPGVEMMHSATPGLLSRKTM